MELLGISPNWLLIWVVTWSINRSGIQGALAGGALGLIHDGMTSGYLLHTFSLAIVGFLTARLQKQRYIQEDFISVALIVFAMTIVSETLTAIQLLVLNLKGANIWSDYQRIALASAILSSLWAPVLYYPLSRWWQQSPRE